MSDLRPGLYFLYETHGEKLIYIKNFITELIWSSSEVLEDVPINIRYYDFFCHGHVHFTIVLTSQCRKQLLNKLDPPFCETLDLNFIKKAIIVILDFYQRKSPGFT